MGAPVHAYSTCAPAPSSAPSSRIRVLLGVHLPGRAAAAVRAPTPPAAPLPRRCPTKEQATAIPAPTPAHRSQPAPALPSTRPGAAGRLCHLCGNAWARTRTRPTPRLLSCRPQTKSRPVGQAHRGSCFPLARIAPTGHCATPGGRAYPPHRRPPGTQAHGGRRAPPGEAEAALPDAGQV